MAFNTELLEEIGLTKAEINVYLALLELGSSTTGPIVEKSRASSSKIYEILDKLIQKGLVSYIIQEGIKHFEAADPKRILDYLQEKQSKLQEQTQEIKAMLPELELKKMLSKYKSEATIYKGMKGMQTAFKELLKGPKSTNYVFVVGEMDERLNDFFKKLYVERALRGIRTKTIFSEAGRSYYESRKGTPLFEGKVIGTTTSPATINIYGTKVNMRMGTSKDVLCVMIDNKELAESFLEQFDALWNQQIQTYEGQQAVERIYSTLVENATPKDDVIVFAAKPQSENAADFNLQWNVNVAQKVKQHRLLYQGKTLINQLRAEELEKLHCKTKIIPTTQILPISTVVLGNTVLNSIWQDTPITFKIENKTLADSYRRNFEMLWNQKVHTFEGFEQVTSFFTNILTDLKEGEEYFVINGNYGGNQQILNFFKTYHPQRRNRGIRANFLFNQNIKPFLSKLALAPCRVKFLPTEFQSPLQITFYKQKLYISVWSSNPIGFLIEQQEVVDAFKAYYEMLWRQAK